MSGSQGLFHLARVWEGYGLSPDYRERIDVVTDIIPRDLATLLDVGCGKGEIVDHLASTGRFRLTVGTDPSLVAMSYVTTARAVAMLPCLPFRNRSFDLVMCMQVLEHLDDGLHARAIGEIQRVANRYVLLGVPYRENLLTKTCLCAECGKTSQADGHLRAYDEGLMARLLPQFVLRQTKLTGVVQARQTDLAMKLRHKVARAYYVPDLFACPWCGSTRASPSAGYRPRFIRIAVGVVNRAIQLTRKKLMPYWSICLYERKVSTDQ